jgi:hypothetical protein
VRVAPSLSSAVEVLRRDVPAWQRQQVSMRGRRRRASSTGAATHHVQDTRRRLCAQNEAASACNATCWRHALVQHSCPTCTLALQCCTAQCTGSDLSQAPLQCCTGHSRHYSGTQGSLKWPTWPVQAVKAKPHSGFDYTVAPPPPPPTPPCCNARAAGPTPPHPATQQAWAPRQPTHPPHRLASRVATWCVRACMRLCVRARACARVCAFVRACVAGVRLVMSSHACVGWSAAAARVACAPSIPLCVRAEACSAESAGLGMARATSPACGPRS